MSFSKPIPSLVNSLFRTRPFADRTLCHFLRQRSTLPPLLLSDLFDDFDEQPVTLRKMPRGSWSTPTQDIVMLVKLALCAKPKRLLEIGSFGGYSAPCLCPYVNGDSKVDPVCRYSENGGAY